MGSLWFAGLVLQNIGYYAVAAVLIPIGIGHLKLRRWTHKLTRLYLMLWLGGGIWLMISFIQIIPFLKKLNLSREILTGRLTVTSIFLVITCIVLPILLLWFYGSDRIKTIFEKDTLSNVVWIEIFPGRILILLVLMSITLLGLHMLIFLQGLMPVFGALMLGRRAVHILSFCILLLGILLYGVVKLRQWAWWGTLGYFFVIALSTAMTLSQYSFYEIVGYMAVPVYEMEIIDKLTFIHDLELVGIVVVPMFVVLILLLYTKRYFVENDRTLSKAS